MKDLINNDKASALKKFRNKLCRTRAIGQARADHKKQKDMSSIKCLKKHARMLKIKK